MKPFRPVPGQPPSAFSTEPVLTTHADRAEDLRKLDALLSDAHVNKLRPDEREAFADMRAQLFGAEGTEIAFDKLTEKHRAWVDRRLEDFEPTYRNDWSAGRVPRGREVPTVDVLKPERLPKRPPVRKKEDE